MGGVELSLSMLKSLRWEWPWEGKGQTGVVSSAEWDSPWLACWWPWWLSQHGMSLFWSYQQERCSKGGQCRSQDQTLQCPVMAPVPLLLVRATSREELSTCIMSGNPQAFHMLAARQDFSLYKWGDFLVKCRAVQYFRIMSLFDLCLFI